jgi:hypothetical protein
MHPALLFRIAPFLAVALMPSARHERADFLRSFRVSRRVFYKLDHERYDVFVGVKITALMDKEIEDARARAGRRRADFVRHLLREGIKAWRLQHLAVRKRSA